MFSVRDRPTLGIVLSFLLPFFWSRIKTQKFHLLTPFDMSAIILLRCGCVSFTVNGDFDISFLFIDAASPYCIERTVQA